MARNLSPDEAALWSRVMASVRPLRGVTAAPRPTPVRAEPAVSKPALPVAGNKKTGAPTSSVRIAKESARSAAKTLAPLRTPANTLDGGWDRRLIRGVVTPDVTVDLHGHTLHSAHDMLDDALARAVARGDRVVLLVTGRPPRPESERPHARGAIRAAVGDWLAGSRHASQIAAVRGAHPRHGGAGALYLVLRRPR